MGVLLLAVEQILVPQVLCDCFTGIARVLPGQPVEPFKVDAKLVDRCNNL